MNFCFVIDTSTSMLQYFDKGYSYFDAAKSAIEHFIKSREYVKNKTNPDKYFLLTTDEGLNVLSSWTDPVEHFLFQLRILQINYSFTNVENSIQTALNVLNNIKKIGPEKHVHGRLVSKIQNSFIMLFTDGGKLTSSRKVFTRNTKIGLNVQNEETQSINPNIKSALMSELYSEPFRWDQNLFTFILNFNPDEEGVQMLKKYSSVIGGGVETIEFYEDMLARVEHYAHKKCYYNRVNINLEINNSVVNLLQQNDLKSSKSVSEKITYNPSNPLPSVTQKIKFVSKNTFHKGVVPLSIDFNMLTIKPPGGKDHPTSDSLIEKMENYNYSYREKWPFPEEIVMTKNQKSLPKKKARPTYIIANEIKYDLSISRSDFDEYEIIDRDFIVKFLENYPDLTISTIRTIFKARFQIAWEVYSNTGSDKNPQSDNLSNLIQKKPFALIRLVVDNKKKPLTYEDTSASDFLKNEIETSKANGSYLTGTPSDSFIKLRFCNLPYNYSEFFSIITSYENKVITNSEFIIQIEKYMKKIPFYYKPYVVQFLEKKKMWKIEESFYKNLDEENLNESVISLIKNISNEEREKIAEVNKMYSLNKQMHLNKISKCCGMHIFKFRAFNKLNLLLAENSQGQSTNLVRTTDNDGNSSVFSENIQEFLNLSSDFNYYIKTLKGLSNLSLEPQQKVGGRPLNQKSDEVMIEKMGDYSEYINSRQPLKNPFVFPDEIKEFKGDYFGNPFRRLSIEKSDIDSIKLNNMNTNINDGESFLLNSIAANKKQLEDDELSVHPNKVAKNKVKILKSALIDSTEEPATENNTLPSTPDHIPSNYLQLQLIDDDMTHDFKELFNKRDYERNGTRVKNKYEIDMNVIYDWKVKEKMKEYSRVILQSIKSNKNIVSLIDDILVKPLLFITEEQKIFFLRKVKYICEAYNSNAARLINKYINDKIKSIKTVL